MIRRSSLSRLGKRHGHSREVESVQEVISACYFPLGIYVERESAFGGERLI